MSSNRETMSYFERLRISQDKTSTKDILTKLSEDKKVGVRENIAQNPSTPKEVLQKLAKDKNEYVRWYVGENKNTPTGVLATLAHDEKESVHESVAQNKNTPSEVLEQLSYENTYTRVYVARNLNTSVSTLTRLGEDKNEIVTNSVIKNPRTPKEVLLGIYSQKVKSDGLKEGLVIELCQRKIFDTSELTALVSLYRKNVAKVVRDTIDVDVGSTLDKVLKSTKR